MKRLGQAVLAALLILGLYATAPEAQVPGGGGVVQYLSPSNVPTSVSAANPLPTTGGGGGGGGAVTAPLGPSTAPSAAVAITDTGTPITGQTIGAGGQGLTGWLSQIYAGVIGYAQGSTTSGQGGPLVQCAVTTAAPTYTTGQTDPLSCDTSGNQRTLDANSAALLAAAQGSIPAGANTIGNVNGAPNVTATDCSGTVTAGGTAQNAFTAQTTLHGFTIVNIDTTEPLWISFTTTAAASGAGSYPLQAATATTFAGPGSFTAPLGFGLNHALSVIAATTAHKFSCTWW
jgi:hypothetical protein